MTTTTNIDVILRFLDVAIETAARPDGSVEVTVAT